MASYTGFSTSMIPRLACAAIAMQPSDMIFRAYSQHIAKVSSWSYRVVITLKLEMHSTQTRAVMERQNNINTTLHSLLLRVMLEDVSREEGMRKPDVVLVTREC